MRVYGDLQFALAALLVLNLALEVRLGSSRRARDGEASRAGAARRRQLGATLAVVGLTLGLCVPWLTRFEARVTDLSALRVAGGEVPYRDFWTMYAPGSFCLLALVFQVLGEQLLWSRLLGAFTTAAAVAALHRLALRAAGAGLAFGAAVLFALAFVHAGYHDSFTSYPPAILCAWLAAGRVAAHAESRRGRDLTGAGLWLGAAVCFKHDVGGYAALACAAALLATAAGRRLRHLSLLVGAALVVVLTVLVWLLAVGSGPDMWQDLVVFPLTHFRHVRPESFPLLPPRVSWPGLELSKLYPVARELEGWATLHLPTLALLLGLPLVWRQRAALAPAAQALLVFALVAYPLLWSAAHVQINTHRVTLAGLGVLVGCAGLTGLVRAASRRWLAALLLVPWSLVLLAGPFETLRLRWRDGVEWLDLPRLRGIQAARSEVPWMRGLAQALAEEAPSAAPLLLAGRRNDVLIYADSMPFWLSPRRPVTRHHELHPGITDIEAVQRRMLEDVARSPRPVVVREHRFDDRVLDFWGREYRRHGVPVGSRLLDEWLAGEYQPRARFGPYEVMARRTR